MGGGIGRLEAELAGKFRLHPDSLVSVKFRKGRAWKQTYYCLLFRQPMAKENGGEGGRSVVAAANFVNSHLPESVPGA